MLCSVGSSTWSLQEFVPTSVGSPSLFPVSCKFEQSEISTDTQLGFQPCGIFSSPIVATKYHQVARPHSRERSEISFEFTIQQLLLAGMAQPKMALHSGKYPS